MQNSASSEKNFEIHSKNHRVHQHVWRNPQFHTIESDCMDSNWSMSTVEYLAAFDQFEETMYHLIF